MRDTKLMESLARAVAPSGAEKSVATIIEKEIAPFCDALSYDKVGNLIAKITPIGKAPRGKKLFLAHMDEVGFMIKNVDGDGRLRLTLLGNVDTRTLSGRRAELTSGVKGVISAKAIHAQSADERSKPTPADKLYLELGAKDKAQALTMVGIGDSGTVEPRFVALENDRYAGKALGGRSMCAILCDMIRKIHENACRTDLEDELYFVFSVKREIARAQFAVEAATFQIQPDMAVVLDAVPCADYDGVPETARGAKCGDGVVIAPADIKTIYHHDLLAKAVAYCEKNGISFQYPTTASGAGNEAGSVHKAGAPVQTISLGIPTRNLHSGSEIISGADVDAVQKLLEYWIQ